MNAPQISTKVLEFLADKIETVPHLETLLLLWQDPGKPWSAEAVASRVYVSLDRARLVLRGLQRHQLVSADAAGHVFRYDDTWDTSGALMTELAMEYRRHLIPIATFIHSGASSSVREFARAFDLKKER